MSASMNDTTRNVYGAQESNSISDEGHAFREGITRTVHLADTDLIKIVRLRMLTDAGFPMLDVSYCWGLTAQGEKVRVILPRQQFRKATWKSDIISMCKEAGRYGKGLGILDADVVSILR